MKASKEMRDNFEEMDYVSAGWKSTIHITVRLEECIVCAGKY